MRKHLYFWRDTLHILATLAYYVYGIICTVLLWCHPTPAWFHFTAFIGAMASFTLVTERNK